MLLLLFETGGQRYGIDSKSVLEVAPLVAFKPVPGAPESVAGLFNYRGTVTPVVDLSMLISGQGTRPLYSSRIVVADYAGADGARHALGLLAEKVTETITRRPDDFEPPGLSLEEVPWLGDITFDAFGMIQVIHVGKVMPESLRRSLFAKAEASS